MSWRGVLGLVVALGLWVPGAVAQEERGRAGGRDEERREEAFRMVDAYIIANIQDSLSLTDEQYEQVIPLVNKLQKERRAYFSRRSGALRRLRRLLGSGSASEAQVTEALQTVKALEAEGPARALEQTEALDAALSPLQQAKFRIFEVDVEARLRRLMRRARREGQTGPEGP